MSRSKLAASVRARIAYLHRAGAQPGMGRAKDVELATNLRLLRKLDPAFDAQARRLAAVPRRARSSARYNAQHSPNPQAYEEALTMSLGYE